MMIVLAIPVRRLKVAMGGKLSFVAHFAVGNLVNQIVKNAIRGIFEEEDK